MKRLATFIFVIATVTVLTLGMMVNSACAVPYTMYFTYDSYGGGSATATGYVQFEGTGNFFNNPTGIDGISDYYDIINGTSDAILGLSITVAGAVSGNGTFTMIDFDGVAWGTNGATLDMSQNLIGQLVFNDPFFGAFNFGDLWVAPVAGEFSLHNDHSSAPDFYEYFILQTAGGTGDLMYLTYMGPTNPVPEPATFMLLGGGLAAISLLRRRYGLGCPARLT